MNRNFIPLMIGIFFSILYKFWKSIISTNQQYLMQQGFYSIYRVIIGILCTYLLIHFYPEIKKQFKLNLSFFKSRFFLIQLLLVIIGNFSIKYFLSSSVLFNAKNLALEFLIDFPVGFFEEILFRGLIFFSLKELLNKKWAIFISALLFALWHYDVIYYRISYLAIFSFGIYVALYLLATESFIEIIIIHAFVDIIHFGFSWNFAGLEAFSEMFFALYNFFLIFLIYKIKRAQINSGPLVNL